MNDQLTNLQIELLKTFSISLDVKQMEEVRQLLSNYFAEMATNEMDKLFAEYNWGSEKTAEWKSGHFRLSL